jgi:glycosyltransferase involved in cell wall biosynthesis
VLVLAEADVRAAGSGAERVLAAHVAGLRARGHAVALVSGGGGAPTREPGLEIARVGWSARTAGAARAAAAALAARGPVDVAVAHHAWAAWRALTLPALAAVPSAYVFLSSWPEEYDVRRPGARGPRHAIGRAVRTAVERRVLRRVGRVLPMSRFMAGRAAALHGLDAGAMAIVPGGVDRARFAPPADRASLRRALGLPDRAPVLFTLRNLEPRMGVDALLRAMPAIAGKHPGAVLVVGGSGPLRASLEREAAALGLGAGVRFAGFVPEERLADHYGAADVFVLPTQALEGFGLVTLEALACGTPVVGTGVGATPEILEPLDPGLVLPGTSADAIAAGVVALLDRPDRDALARRCRAYTERLDWGRAIDALERELTALVRRRRGESA